MRPRSCGLDFPRLANRDVERVRHPFSLVSESFTSVNATHGAAELD